MNHTYIELPVSAARPQGLYFSAYWTDLGGPIRLSHTGDEDNNPVPLTREELIVTMDQIEAVHDKMNGILSDAELEALAAEKYVRRIERLIRPEGPGASYIQLIRLREARALLAK